MKDNNELIDGLVSIIMPAYNSYNYVEHSIVSVQNQLYKEWELIIIDDHSTDQTTELVEGLNDSRIRLIKLEKNSGAAYARNVGIEIAKGEYLAFLDSDDLWTKEKLLNQIDFMKTNQHSFSCTEYAEMNEENYIVNVVKVKDSLDYNGVLKFCPGNSTVMYNAKKLGKHYAPIIKRRNDFALWLSVIKSAGAIHGLKETHSIYRVRQHSLSSNKSKLIKYQWKVYREIENLPIFKSIYLLLHKIFTVLVRPNTYKNIS